MWYARMHKYVLIFHPGKGRLMKGYSGVFRFLSEEKGFINDKVT